MALFIKLCMVHSNQTFLGENASTGCEKSTTNDPEAKYAIAINFPFLPILMSLDFSLLSCEFLSPWSF